MRGTRKERGAGAGAWRGVVEDEAAPAFGIVIWPGAGGGAAEAAPAPRGTRVPLRHAFAPRWPV